MLLICSAARPAVAQAQQSPSPTPQPVPVATLTPRSRPIQLQQEIRVQSLHHMADKVSDRFVNYQTLMQNWVQLANSRDQKMKASGKDTSAIENILATTQADLQTASASGQSVVTQLRNANAATTDIEAIKTAVRTAQKDYIQVVKDFHAVIQAMRAV